MIATMAAAVQFLHYWVLAFVTLCVALVMLNLFYRWIDCDLCLHGFRKEAVIVIIASAVQGAGFWFSASLFHGDAFRRPILVIPFALVGIIYWLAHLEDWSGYEMGGILLSQAVILGVGFCVVGGMLGLAVIILGAFAVGLAVIASIARGL
jgi:hypothetical protein